MPLPDDAWFANKKFTREDMERALATFQKELDTNAPEIARIFNQD